MESSVCFYRPHTPVTGAWTGLGEALFWTKPVYLMIERSRTREERRENRERLAWGTQA